MSVIFYGDPHGEWRPLLHACEEERPDGVVIVGDCDLDRPIRQRLKPLFDAGIRVRWIPGNHDTDTVEWHDRLWRGFPEGNLNARWEQVGGVIVAGLGGVFKERVWYPRFDDAEPVIACRCPCGTRSFARMFAPCPACELRCWSPTRRQAPTGTASSLPTGRRRSAVRSC